MIKTAPLPSRRVGGKPAFASLAVSNQEIFTLGRRHYDAGRFAEAEKCFRQMIAMYPNTADGRYWLACTFYRRGRLSEAVPPLREALALKPEAEIVWKLLAQCLLATNPPAALSLLQSVHCPRSISPDERRSCLISAYRMLWEATPLQNIARGLCNEQNALPVRVVRCWNGMPDNLAGGETRVLFWDGSPLPGGMRTLYLYDDEGIGDTMQFCRLIASARAASGASRLVLAVRPALMRFFSEKQNCAAFGLDPSTDLIVPHEGKPPESFAGEHPGENDRLSYTGLLAGLLATTFYKNPVPVPYVWANPDQAEGRKTKLRSLSDPDTVLRVGIVWAAQGDEHRCCPASLFASLASIPGVKLFSVQKGPQESDIEQIPGAVSLSIDIQDIADTAAILSALDLVITVDTSVAHLAGAMGKPVWILLKREACFRWLLNRSDSPWYPSARLYRQECPREWGPALARVKADLCLLVRAIGEGY